MAHALLCIVNWDHSAVVHFFCPWWPWPLTFELGRDFYTLYLTVKFDRPTFSCLKVIVRTNKQTDATENIHLTSLHYAGGYIPLHLNTSLHILVKYLCSNIAIHRSRVKQTSMQHSAIKNSCWKNIHPAMSVSFCSLTKAYLQWPHWRTHRMTYAHRSTRRKM